MCSAIRKMPQEYVKNHNFPWKVHNIRYGTTLNCKLCENTYVVWLKHTSHLFPTFKGFPITNLLRQQKFSKHQITKAFFCLFLTKDCTPVHH